MGNIAFLRLVVIISIWHAWVAIPISLPLVGFVINEGTVKTVAFLLRRAMELILTPRLPALCYFFTLAFLCSEGRRWLAGWMACLLVGRSTIPSAFQGSSIHSPLPNSEASALVHKSHLHTNYHLPCKHQVLLASSRITTHPLTWSSLNIIAYAETLVR